MARIPEDRLKNSINRYLTKSLFREYGLHRESNKGEYPYTLRDYDKGNSLSMHNIYVTHDSEYDAALDLLGSWEHWKKLKACTWFKPYYTAWEEERKLRLDSIAKRVLVQQAEDGNTTAAKAILDMHKDKSRGRPSNQEKAKVAKEEREIEEFLTKALKNVTPINKKKILNNNG